MQSILHLWNGQPDFTNEDGVKWWNDEATTSYARERDRFGITLEATGFAIEFPDKKRTRVLVDKNGAIIEEDTILDGIGFKIDKRKLLKRTSPLFSIL